MQAGGRQKKEESRISGEISEVPDWSGEPAGEAGSPLLFAAWGSSRGFMFGRLLRLDEPIKNCAVLNHCRAQFFRCGIGLIQANRDGVSQAVLFHDARIAYRDIGGTLFKARSEEHTSE